MVHIDGAAPDDLGIMHKARVTHVDIQKVTLVDTDGFKLDGMEQFPVKVASHKQSRWYNANIMPSIYLPATLLL